MSMIDENQPNGTKERLSRVLSLLSTAQIRFVVARNETKSDKEAAELIGISASTVKGWEDKALVDEAVRLMAFDGVITALELRRRNLAKAMAVKASGLDSDNEKIRQDVATEIIEWELGKASQKIDQNNSGDLTIRIIEGGDNADS